MFLLMLAQATAATLLVGVDADTIQETIDLAADGDVIEIPAGTWTEAIDFGDRSITIRGVGVGAGGTVLAPGTVVGVSAW